MHSSTAPAVRTAVLIYHLPKPVKPTRFKSELSVAGKSGVDGNVPIPLRDIEHVLDRVGLPLQRVGLDALQSLVPIFSEGYRR
jgi:hypothetical protein